ncbi:hypothetical protein HG537_0F02910 [Torulaspora globosa]|uniref:Elongator complex protein 4 n=1 Tax=Torulaspora globosa TaxID=48254 RepID=A0A7H9HVX0_9SACH|nr:hypothetical protein HG537_0F02910 [Torulaspora sp. CBS 2947]
MSFRKRGEVINGGNSGIRAVRQTLPNATPRDGPTARTTFGGRPLARHDVRSPGLSDRMQKLSVRDREISAKPGETAENGLDAGHPGVRPSPSSSHQTTSTGSFHLDKVLGHTGLPLGNSLLVEEMGTTDFSSVLSKLFAAQGIVHNRAESVAGTGNTHLIVLSIDQNFAKELPGVYKGSRKEVKKSKIAEEESKVTVQNLTGKTNPTRYKDLKIAWRYKLADEADDAGKSSEVQAEDANKLYSNQFDITTRLMPAPTASEISFVSPLQPIQTVLAQLEQVIKKNDKKLVRIIVPSLLHPAMYPPSMFSMAKIMPLLHGLRSLVKKYENRCVMFSSLSTDMVDEILIAQIENSFDSVMKLEPFGQEMIQFLEKAYKSQPNKVQQGLLHISKLPIFSDKGEMHVINSSYAFKNSKRKFEIEEWGIPVEDVDEPSENTTQEHIGTAHEISKQTNVALDF